MSFVLVYISYISHRIHSDLWKNNFIQLVSIFNQNHCISTCIYIMDHVGELCSIYLGGHV